MPRQARLTDSPRSAGNYKGNPTGKLDVDKREQMRKKLSQNIQADKTQRQKVVNKVNANTELIPAITTSRRPEPPTS